MNHPEMSTRIQCDGYVMVITFMDLHKKEGGFKLFQTIEESTEYIHNISLERSPEWHKEKCNICIKEQK